MQKELKKPQVEGEKIDPSQIKQEFAQMNKQAAEQQPLTEEDIRKRRAEEEKKLDEVLPYLRKQKEATELEIALTEMDVLLGRIDPTKIPGPIGKKIEIDLMDIQLGWSQRKIDQQSMVKNAIKEKNELMKQQIEEQASTIQGQAQSAILDKYKEELGLKVAELEKETKAKEQTQQ